MNLSGEYMELFGNSLALAEVSIGRFEPLGQLDDCRALIIQQDRAVIDVLEFRTLDASVDQRPCRSPKRL